MSKNIEYFSSSTIKRSIRLLERRDLSKLGLVAVLQVLSGLLDLAGVAVIGVIGALAVNGVQSRQPGNRVSRFLEIFHIQDLTFQSQVAILGLVASSFLIARTLLSILFTRRTLFFLSRKSATISNQLLARILNQRLLWIKKRTSQETLFAVSDGVSSIMVGIVGNLVGLLSDLSLLIIMLTGLFLVDPAIAFGTLMTFSLIGASIYGLLHKRALKLGIRGAELKIEANEKIIEVLSVYRELIVRNRREFYSREVSKLRFEYADTLAESTFMPNISKYVIESIIVLGTLAICSIQFATQDATHAVATLSVFLAAGMRIAPAVLRLQQSALSMRGALGIASPTLEIIEYLGSSKFISKVADDLVLTHDDFISKVEINNVSLVYANERGETLRNVNLEVNPGDFIAIVGPSGAGKTSLVDVLLGILEPTNGNVKISGLSPESAIEVWPGAIAYVPQDVVIVKGTIWENVALGYPKSSVDEKLIALALQMAKLDSFVSQLPLGINTEVGEDGIRLSGGQRQRLGIARALLSKPKLLVLDEATSSLDGETEMEISESIQDLKGDVTIIMIAHRLSTVRKADKVIYLNEGKVISVGSFQQVRASVPDFDHQAQLMGL